MATDADFDIRKLIPAPTNTPDDAGPYITMGLVLGSDPEKTMSDVTIHRMVLEDKDTIGMYIMPGGRHIGAFQKMFEAKNEPMPVTINIGLDPAIPTPPCKRILIQIQAMRCQSFQDITGQPILRLMF